MSISGFCKSYWFRAARCWIEWRVARQSPVLSLERSSWAHSLRDPTESWAECTRFFHRDLPAEFRKHRAYFYNVPGNRRGFGENAFHAMWYLLLQEFKPSNFLEIGVFRGQVISLVTLWSRVANLSCEIWGISPFSNAADSTSRYPELDYYADTLQNFDHFKLAHPHLLRALSIDREATQLISSKSWDMIYIDGCHDYDIARRDWECCSASLRRGGIIVLDDAGLETPYHPRFFATGGVAGPSKLAREIDRSQFTEVLQVGHNRAFQKL